MTNEQMIFIGTLVTVLATYLTNRTSGLNQTINTLSKTIIDLRTDITAERKARQDSENDYKIKLKDMGTAFNAEITVEREARQRSEDAYKIKLRDMANSFEDERNRYRRYITKLLKQLHDNQIVPVEWDVD